MVSLVVFPSFRRENLTARLLAPLPPRSPFVKPVHRTQRQGTQEQRRREGQRRGRGAQRACCLNAQRRRQQLPRACWILWTKQASAWGLQGSRNLQRACGLCVHAAKMTS